MAETRWIEGRGPIGGESDERWEWREDQMWRTHFQAGCWQEASVPGHMGLSQGAAGHF